MLGSVATIASAAPRAAEKSQAITIAVDEFPPVLNDMTTAGNGAWTAMIAGPALARGYKLLPDFSYEPWIFDKDCTVVTQAPFTVDCTIRPDAKWSDGVAITATDFKFTYDTIMNTKNDVVSRNGYDKITAFNLVSPTRVPDGVPGGVRALPRAVGRIEHHGAPAAHPRGARTSTRSGTTASAIPRPRSRSAAGR